MGGRGQLHGCLLGLGALAVALGPPRGPPMTELALTELAHLCDQVTKGHSQVTPTDRGHLYLLRPNICVMF